MTAFQIAKQIDNLETAADLLLRTAAALRSWDVTHDWGSEETLARELHYRALVLRLTLSIEQREKVLH